MSNTVGSGRLHPSPVTDESGAMTDLNVDARTLDTDHTVTVEILRGPDNFFDLELLTELADRLCELDADPRCRAVVLTSQGRNFCAGAQLAAAPEQSEAAVRQSIEQGIEINPLYVQAIRLFAVSIPVVAAVQGAAVGGGLGLAVSADLRVAAPESRFSANFARLGFYPGFGLTFSLPYLVGASAAAELFYTGRRIGGVEAHRLGLCDHLVADAESIRPKATELAREIAGSALSSLSRLKKELRAELVEGVRAAVRVETAQQNDLLQTRDFAEGIAAMRERRPPRFAGS